VSGVCIRFIRSYSPLSKQFKIFDQEFFKRGCIENNQILPLAMP
jgi:hypothetical protein